MIGTNEALKERLTSFGKNLSTYLANLRKYTDYIRDTDNIVFMRIEEVVLMKAEALFRLGRDAEALAALKQIANARGAIAHTVVNEDEILLERQKELCFEGLRFDDLARFKRSVPPCAPIGDLTKEAYEYSTNLFA